MTPDKIKIPIPALDLIFQPLGNIKNLKSNIELSKTGDTRQDRDPHPSLFFIPAFLTQLFLPQLILLKF